MSGVPLKRLDLEGFRQDGETKLEKETARLLGAWPRTASLSLLGHKLLHGRAGPRPAEALSGERALSQDGA